LRARFFSGNVVFLNRPEEAMAADDSRYSRRAFLAAAGLASSALGAEPQTGTEDAPPSPSELTEIDFRKLISPSDLVYTKPAPRSEEGIPVGNGRVGSLVWTTPGQMRLQVNRVDVYANNCATNSFFERHDDYCGGCAYLDIEFGGQPFPESGFGQRLSVYDGGLEIGGEGVRARVFAWPAEDVMAIAVDDHRTAPGPVAAVLRMLRYETKYFGAQLETMARDHTVTVQHRSQTAASRLIVQGDRIALTQDFREGTYCSKSAVAVAVEGRQGAARIVNETDVSVSAEGSGPFTILIASAATFDANEDVAAAAFRALDAARAKGVPAVEKETRDWWHNFWARSCVYMTGDDGAAGLVQRDYHYFLYLMGASSRGKFPTKFNGMLWNTGGDLRTWGGQHWFANLSCYYEGLPEADRFELMDPMYDMYSGMFDACSAAARQQWGSQGMYIPETTYFDGLEKLPDAIAAEMRDLYLRKKPWEQRSKEFMEFAQTKHPHSSRWNWIQSGEWKNGRYVITERGFGPYGPVTHIFGSNAKVAYLYWRRYEFTRDREWLRTRAYPMLRGAVEFYRNHPNVKKGADGKYHIHWANSNEGVYGACDTDEDLASMRGVTGALVRAATILDTEAEMRPVWREFLDNLAPLPTSDDPEALLSADYKGPRVFVRGLKPVVKAIGMLPDGNSLPMWFFDLCHVEARDRETVATAGATFDHLLRNGLRPDTPVQVLSKVAIAAASLGRADAVRILIPNQMRGLLAERGTAYKNGGVLANRMMLREGPQALDAERLGRATQALHLALVQSNPPAPGEDPVLRVFPAWPKQWNGRFTLLARGGFRVTSSMRNGAVEFVELESRAGAPCKLRNPFGGSAVLYRDGKAAETLSGSLVEFGTRKGERIVVVAAGARPAQFRRAIPEG
jgi:hypothetical protein